MRSIWRSGAPVLLAAALLAGCSLQGSGGATSAPPDSGVTEHWSVLEGEARLPAVGTRWTSGPMEELTPSPDYGELVPYAGAGYYLVYPDGEGGTVQSPSLSTLYGLMTVDGCTVLDPVCTGVYASSYLDGQGESHTLPVWELTRTDPEAGNPRNGRLTALAARDGSWVTPFRYWAAAGSPLGVFAGDGTGLSLLSTETGEVLKSWTWAQLGVEDLEDFPWFANDMETTAQWAGDAFFLGIWGEGYTAHLLDPETGAVATLSAQAWYERDGARYTAQTGWQAEAAEDGTVTVSKGDTSYTFQSPLPAVQYPYVQEDRVFFYDYGSSAAAVTTLEGKTVLTAPLGQLNTLFGEDVRYLAACPQDGADWTLYSWDGEALVTLPGGTGSWCSLQGPLVEVLGQEGAAYYRPDSGACVFRAWFDLEERPGLAQSEEQSEQLP